MAAKDQHLAGDSLRVEPIIDEASEFVSSDTRTNDNDGAYDRSMLQLGALGEGMKFLSKQAGEASEKFNAQFRAPVNRKERRSIGQTSAAKVVKLADEVEWPDGRVTVESFPSKRAPKRVSGGRRRGN